MDAQRGRQTATGTPETEGEVVGRCPHLHEGAANLLYPEIAYCFGLGGGRLMVPSRDEYRRLCTSGHHVDCSVFRANAGVSPVREGAA